MAPPSAVVNRLADVRRLARDENAAGAGERLIGRAGLQLLGGKAHDLVDIAVIVREQNIFLEVLGRRAGVMAKARQAEIGARRIEERERRGLRRIADQKAVAELVADMGEVRRRKIPRQLGGRGALQIEPGIGKDIRVSDLARGEPGFDLDAVVGNERLQLLQEIGAEEIGPRDGDGIGAGGVQAREGPRRVLEPQRRAAMDDPQLRIDEKAARALDGRRRMAVEREALERRAQGRDGAGIGLGEAVDRLFGCRAANEATHACEITPRRALRGLIRRPASSVSRAQTSC